MDATTHIGKGGARDGAAEATGVQDGLDTEGSEDFPDLGPVEANGGACVEDDCDD
jgi:hypothetical protein